MKEDYIDSFYIVNCVFSEGDDLDDQENFTLEDIKTKVMLLNDKIQNNMWFV